MLQITIPATELYDEKLEKFVKVKSVDLQLEHSLVSISKWEAKWHKPFLGSDAKSAEETLDYVKCMTITPHVDPYAYMALTQANVDEVSKYIQDPMTATWFRDDKNKRPNREVITSELIYYWMIALNIPSEYQKWHLNRLLTLIRVCNEKNQPNKKKMSKADLAKRNSSLNAARRQANHTSG